MRVFRSLLAVVGSTLVSSFVLPAAAEFRNENATGGYSLFYGQFDPAYLSFNDGVGMTSKLVDNASSNSRFGLWIRQPFDTNSFAFNFETAFGFRSSDDLSQTYTPDVIDLERTNIRMVDFSSMTETYGSIYVGQGSMATDGVTKLDLSGTSLETDDSISENAGAFEFRNTANALSGVTIGTAFDNFDGGRRGRIRYDTPEFAGFHVAAA